MQSVFSCFTIDCVRAVVAGIIPEIFSLNLAQLTAEGAVIRLLEADFFAESVALLDGVEAGRKAAHPQLGEVVAQPAAALEHDDGNSDKHSLLQVPFECKGKSPLSPLRQIEAHFCLRVIW